MGNSFFLIKQNSKFKYIYTFINKKWYFDRFYNEFVSQNILNLSYVFSYKDVDRGFLEKIGPSGIVQPIKGFFNKLKNLQSGFIYHYLFLMFVSMFVIILFTIFPQSLSLVLNSTIFLGLIA